MDGWNTSFLLGWPIFRGYVSFREGRARSFHSPLKHPSDFPKCAPGFPPKKIRFGTGGSPCHVVFRVGSEPGTPESQIYKVARVF